MSGGRCHPVTTPGRPDPSRCQRRSVQTKRWRLRRATGLIADTDLIDAAPALARIRQMAEECTPRQIHRATGLSISYVREILNGSKNPARMTVGASRGVMAAPDTAPDTFVPLALYRQRAYSLAAMGYPLKWTAGQLGRTTLHLGAGKRPDGQVRALTFQPLDELYRRIGHIPAEQNPDPAHPLSAKQITMAKNAARANGYHPPACYDDDGTLIPGAVRDERIEARRAERDRMARERLDVLRLTLDHGAIPADIEACLGTGPALVQKIRGEAGLRFYPDSGGRARLRPESAARAAAVRAILDAHYRDPLSDPYRVCREIGMMQAAKYGRLDPADADMA